MKQFLQVNCKTLFLGFTGILGWNNAVIANTPPNIIFLLADDLGWMDVGYMGSKYYETPNIDQLAKEGMRFTNAYANAPNSAPSRACILTGLYTPRHGIYTVVNSDRGKSEDRKLIPIANTTELDTNFVTIAETLKTKGYKSISIGKWHMGKDNGQDPIGQGFDENIGGLDWGAPETYFSPYKNPKLTDGKDGEYLTDRLANEAIRFIKENKTGPFFVYLPFYAVHTPIQGKPELIAKFKLKPVEGRQRNPNYAAMVYSLDEAVGKINDAIKKLNLEENTIIIFLSDNGGHGSFTGNEPLRGSKGMLYEGGIREPFIFKWKNKVKTNTENNTPIIGLDLYPTIQELAGIKPTSTLDGQSILPLVKKEGRFKSRSLFWHFPVYLERYDGMKEEGPFRTTPAAAIRKNDWKLIEFFEDGKLELYNLKNDIGETRNLAEKNPGKLKELYNEMINWRKATNAPVPKELNPEYRK